MEIPAYLMKPGFLEKQDLKGSWQGMRYRLHMADAGESGGILEKGRAADAEGAVPDSGPADDSPEKSGEKRLYAWVWPQPLCFEAADGAGMERAVFDFSPEGIEAAGRWLGLQYESRKELWKRSRL